MSLKPWPLFRAAAYLTGRGVSYGAPLTLPQSVHQGVYSVCVGLQNGQGVAAVDDNLEMFADASLDHVYLSPQIAAFSKPNEIIRESAKKLKLGGHLVILVPLKSDPGKYTFTKDEIAWWLKEVAHWKLKAEYLEDDLYMVIVKRVEGRRGLDPIDPKPAKRACVARYGALGDAIIMSPLLRKLKEDGYHVTLNISRYCKAVFENNPHVDNVLIQERDLIPNPMLGEYWKMWSAEYDRYINLSESIEGDLLVIEGRAPFFTTKAWRHKMCNANYYDYTMARGGYPAELGTRGELFFTRAEERKASSFFEPMKDKFVVVWALNGSSHHKVYPLLEPTLLEWFKLHPDSICITTGDYTAKLLEFEHPQLLTRAGAWSIRESLISTKYADLVVGPETMMTNAAGCYPTPKIVLLSHSSRENLTKYFENDFSLEPDCACYPCHQLHYTKDSCPTGEMKDTATDQVLGQAPLCAVSISPLRVLDQMEQIYQTWVGRAKQSVGA